MKPSKTPWTDYSGELKLPQNRYLRFFLATAGSVSLVLGVIGIFLPLLPTTPFLLLAAFCYARSSPKFYNWLLNNPVFGPAIAQWKATGTVSLRAKCLAILFLTVSITTSIVFFVPLTSLKIGIASIGVAVAIYLLRIPTHKNKNK